MAYRQPSERRERPSDANAMSYLEHFLEQIEGLPAQTKTTFGEIRLLDDKVNNMLSSAQAAAEQTTQRSATKGVPIETARRTYHEFIHLQNGAKDLADRKLALATSMFSSVDTVISELDRRLVEFEAQLKRDGRWPGANPPTVTPLLSTPDLARADRPQPAKAPRTDPTTSAASSPNPTGGAPPTRAGLKGRSRDVTATLQPVAPRARAGGGATRSAAAAAAAAVAAAAAASASPTEGSPAMSPAPATPVASVETPDVSAPSKAVVTPKSEAETVTATDTQGEVETASVANVPGDNLFADKDVVMGEATPTPAAGTGEATNVDEALYCTCKKVSHGDMIACEGKNCLIEWYHFECVGLKAAPAGAWFCPTCKDKRRKSGGARRKYNN